MRVSCKVVLAGDGAASSIHYSCGQLVRWLGEYPMDR